MTTSAARALWMRLEPIHACAYYSPESAEELGRLDLTGWAAYVAGRSAPLGQVPASVVTACFFNFAPGLIERCVPSCWTNCTPEDAWSGRLTGTDRTLRRLLGNDAVQSPEVADAARIARRAAEAAPPDGRPFFAAHSHLEWPNEPHLVLWQAITLLREHRGDGHSAAAIAHGLTGLETHVTHAAATKLTSKEIVTTRRGWSDAEWDEATRTLRERSVLDDNDELTAEGKAMRASVEDATDRAAAGAWQGLTSDDAGRLAATGGKLSESVIASEGLPAGNALALPRWWEQAPEPAT
jgi:hypothetical protein